MSNPFVSRGRPRRHLYTAFADVVIAAVAAGFWKDLIPVHNAYLAMVPHWVWPALAIGFFISAMFSYHRHTTLRSR